jgi:hypothetical protein
VLRDALRDISLENGKKRRNLSFIAPEQQR